MRMLNPPRMANALTGVRPASSAIRNVVLLFDERLDHLLTLAAIDADLVGEGKPAPAVPVLRRGHH